jgi:hypothetical protein
MTRSHSPSSRGVELTLQLSVRKIARAVVDAQDDDGARSLIERRLDFVDDDVAPFRNEELAGAGDVRWSADHGKSPELVAALFYAIDDVSCGRFVVGRDVGDDIFWED